MMPDWALATARALHLIAILQLAGLFPALAWVARDAKPEARRRIRRLGWLALALAAASGLFWLVVQAAAMSGRAPDGETLAAALLHTLFGRALLVRLALALVLAVLLAKGRPGLGLLPAAGLAASLAWSGHAAAGDAAHLAADVVHLLASALWLGGLLPLVVVLRAGDAKAALSRFSWLGVAAVAALAASGIANSIFLVGSAPGLFGTPHGHALLAKLALFAAMLGLAAWNRQVLTPRGATAPLIRTTLAEAALAVGLLGLVGVLGTLPPGLHAESRWPFPYRVEFTWPPQVLPATPTSFARPAPFTAAALVQGRRLYDEHCRGCHGEAPRPLGAGDAYWWATEGHGRRLLADGPEAWSVVHALAARAPELSPEVTAAPGLPAPDFDYDTPSGEIAALSEDEPARPTLLVFFDESRPSRQRLNQLALRRPAIEALGARILAIDTASPEAPADNELAVAVAPEVVEAYALLVPGPAGHREVLLDRAGTLRAAWRPDDVLDWRAAKVLSRQIETLAAEGPGAKAHRH